MKILTDLLKNRPYGTNIALAMCVMGLGDLSAQYIEQKPNKFKLDKFRSLTLISYSGLLIAPLSVVVYSNINKRIIGESLKQATKRGLLSNCFMNPVGNFLFFSYSTFVESNLKATSFSFKESKLKIKSKLKEKYVKTCVNAFVFWVPINILNFWIVPQNYRVLCAFFVAAIWNCYLSLIQHES